MANAQVKRGRNLRLPFPGTPGANNAITNTHFCGVARDATIRWLVSRGAGTGQDLGAAGCG